MTSFDFAVSNTVLLTGSTNINTHEVAKFISRLAGNHDQHGFFFTLNQDIFVERYIRVLIERRHLVCPGIRDNYARFNIGADKQLESSDFQKVLRNRDLEEARQDFRRSSDELHYIKLHGSYDWRDEQNQTRMIIGTNKPQQIAKEPLVGVGREGTHEDNS